MSNEIDLSKYRGALGCFATGVAVVTTLDKNAKRVGITVNSFSSVSLEPPLVLWSIDNTSLRFAAFVESEYFAVNVLASDQRDVCDRFASSGDDLFAGLECREGVGGNPVLPEYSASFECQMEHQYEGGDHRIIIGRVLRFDDHRTDPLIFYRGHFLT